MAKRVKKAAPRRSKPARPQYAEGDVFALPAEDLGWTLGVIARGKRKPRGESTLLVYLFDAVTPKRPSSCPSGLKCEDAVAMLRTSSMGLSNGEWRVLGRVDPFVRAEWPLPVFISGVDSITGYLLWQYDDDDIESLPETNEYVNPRKFRGPRNSLFGYKAAEYFASAAILATRAGECKRGEYGWHLPGKYKQPE